MWAFDIVIWLVSKIYEYVFMVMLRFWNGMWCLIKLTFVVLLSLSVKKCSAFICLVKYVVDYRTNRSVWGKNLSLFSQFITPRACSKTLYVVHSLNCGFLCVCYFFYGVGVHWVSVVQGQLIAFHTHIHIYMYRIKHDVSPLIKILYSS